MVGINVNKGDALYWASAGGHTKVVKALLAAKDINVKQTNEYGACGDNPLYIATKNNHTEIIQLLKDAGAQKSLFNFWGPLKDAGAK